MSKKEWLQEALAVVLGMGVIFAGVAILLLVREGGSVMMEEYICPCCGE